MSELCTWTRVLLLLLLLLRRLLRLLLLRLFFLILLLLLAKVCAYVFLEDTRAHASRRAHTGSPTAALRRVFFCSWREAADRGARSYVLAYTHVHHASVWALYPVERVPAHLY